MFYSSKPFTIEEVFYPFSYDVFLSEGRLTCCPIDGYPDVISPYFIHDDMTCIMKRGSLTIVLSHQVISYNNFVIDDLVYESKEVIGFEIVDIFLPNTEEFVLTYIYAL